MTWCEENDVDYVFGLPGTKPLSKKVDETADAVRTERAVGDKDILLGRYWDDRAVPRDKSYREDVETARRATRPSDWRSGKFASACRKHPAPKHERHENKKLDQREGAGNVVQPIKEKDHSGGDRGGDNRRRDNLSRLSRRNVVRHALT